MVASKSFANRLFRLIQAKKRSTDPRTMLPNVALSGRYASSVQAVGGSLLGPVVVGMRVDLSRANQGHHRI
jgi:hypothetical protein